MLACLEVEILQQRATIALVHSRDGEQGKAVALADSLTRESAKREKMAGSLFCRWAISFS
jgi:hypothetical protein